MAVKIHVRYLQVLLTEMFMVKNGIAPKIIGGISKLLNPTYNLRTKEFCFKPFENGILWYWVTFLPGSKIMGSFISGLENINVTNTAQIPVIVFCLFAYLYFM